MRRAGMAFVALWLLASGAMAAPCGVTVPNSAASTLQATLDDPAGPKVVCLGEGLFTLGAPLRMRRNGLRLIGAGPKGTFVRFTDPAGEGIVLEPPTGQSMAGGMSVEGLQISGAAVGITLDRVSKIAIRDIETADVTTAVVIGRYGQATGVGGVWVEDSRFETRLHGTGIVINGRSGIWISRVGINGSGTPEAPSNSAGILIRGTEGVDTLWVTATSIEQHGTGVRMGGAAGRYVDAFFAGVVVDRYVSAAFHLEGAGDIRSVSFTGCWANGAGPAYVISRVGPGELSRITLDGNIVDGAGGHAVWIVGAVAEVTVTDNVLVYAPGSQAVYIHPSATQIVQADNVATEGPGR